MSFSSTQQNYVVAATSGQYLGLSVEAALCKNTADPDSGSSAGLQRLAEREFARPLRTGWEGYANA